MWMYYKLYNINIQNVITLIHINIDLDWPLSCQKENLNIIPDYINNIILRYTELLGEKICKFNILCLPFLKSDMSISTYSFCKFIFRFFVMLAANMSALWVKSWLPTLKELFISFILLQRIYPKLWEQLEDLFS